MISIGAQWAVVQTAAWVGMAVSYTIKEGSLSKGLSNTFDGKHPCKFCSIVKKGSASDQKDPKQETAKKKLELFSHSVTITALSMPAATVQMAPFEDWAEMRSLVPLLEPPRRA